MPYTSQKNAPKCSNKIYRFQRWLLLHGKQEQALRSLTWIRAGASSRFDLLREYEEMKLNVEHEIMNRANVRFLDQFTRRHIRRTLISVGVGVINPAVAGMFAMAFMTYFMQVVSFILFLRRY